MSLQIVNLPLREEGAERIVASIADPIAKNLLRIAIAEARMRFAREAASDEEQWRNRLPAAPFDMEFFASVVSAVFARRELIKRLLQGESVPQASGWDV